MTHLLKNWLQIANVVSGIIATFAAVNAERMKKGILMIMLMCASVVMAHQQENKKVSSPNGSLTLAVEDGGLGVYRGLQEVLQIPVLGFGGTMLEQPAFVRHIDDHYTMLAGKRLECSYEANDYKTTMSDGVRMVVRLSDDGIAFRYEIPEGKTIRLQDERTTYRIAEGTRRWMQQWTDSYEGFFPLDTTYKVKPVPSFSGISKSAEGYNSHWGYPALIEPADSLFVLLSEADIERGQSASSLMNDQELFRVTPAECPSPATGAWHTPWRVAIIGTLKDVVESTLVTDVSEPCKLESTQWIRPGVVSWIYWAYNHGSKDYQIIRKYVDMAVALKLPYVLIDAEWDEMGDTIEDAIGYAHEKGILPLIWYNSSIGWVDGAPTPKYRLNKPEDREREFAWCERLGVAGVKIDFFSGDNQANMDYCIDLLEAAARHHLLVNFHGATIPRGWQRTYPNLLSTEGVYGAEWYNNVPTFTTKAASHNATLPFTRNVIGPMDYTPCTFSDSQHPHITTNAHELALTVLFESGLQHLADRPESYLSQPAQVQDFLSTLPAVWDETRFVSGYPGEYAVLARRSGDRWFVAGVNGTDTVRDIPLTISDIPINWQVSIAFLDSDSDRGEWDIQTSGGQLPKTVTCQPRGGFVFVVR